MFATCRPFILNGFQAKNVFAWSRTHASARVIRAADVLHRGGGGGVQSQQRSQVRLLPRLHHVVGPQGVHGAGGLAAECVLLQEGQLCAGLVAGALLPP